LIGNSIKYSPDGGDVVVRAAPKNEHDTEGALIEVSDQGIGIKPADLDRVFERFQRGDNVPQRISGTGVGLAYVRNVVDQHGGHVTVQSQLGEGSVFTLWLPLRTPEPIPADANTVGETGGGAARLEGGG